MGLSIQVGLLSELNKDDEEGAMSFRNAFQRINSVLSENGLPRHQEPELISLTPMELQSGFSYPDLHYLRRFFAYSISMPNWKPKPFPKSDNPVCDRILTENVHLTSSHLLFHSDCDGYYVPVDFKKPIIGPLEARIPGVMLGSSQGLMRELVSVAPYLGIKLTNGELSPSDLKRAERMSSGRSPTWFFLGSPFWLEVEVWLSLYKAARLSLKYSSAICFC